MCEGEQCDHKSKRFHFALRKGFKHAHNKNNYIQLCAKCHRNYDITEEEKERLKKQNPSPLGSKHTKKQIEKIIFSTKGKINIGNKHSAKVVIQYSKDGNELREHASLKEAAEQVGLRSSSAIWYSCKDKNFKHTAGGYKWRYLTM
jgi:tRNA G10  N-methylase Trm11